MRAQFVSIITVAITAFIPWLLILASLGPAGALPRVLFILVHYTLDVLLFGIAFAHYFKGHQHEDPFVVMVVAMLSLFMYEIVFFKFFYQGEMWFFSYWDWIVPAFIIASTIYFIGKVLR